METTNSNTPAFPCYDPKAPASEFDWPCGLTKREHFALEFAKALMVNAGRNGYHAGRDENLLKDAINTADGLLAALETGA